MDEPAASLDPISTAALEGSIIAMKGRYTVAIVTHDMHEALRVSDFTAFMYMGKIVERGDTKRLFSSPSMPETKAYLTGQLVSVATSQVPQ
jgi:phosphate transport system ATP-binding protein